MRGARGAPLHGGQARVLERLLPARRRERRPAGHAAGLPGRAQAVRQARGPVARRELAARADAAQQALRARAA